MSGSRNAAFILAWVVAACIVVAPAGPVAAAVPVCGPSGSHTICVSLASTALSGPTLVSVSNSPNSGNLVYTWAPSGKSQVGLMQQGGPSALTGGADYTFLWPTQKFLDASGLLKVRFGGSSNSSVAVAISLVNGNLSQIQPSPGDWSDFLPPTSWSGGSDPVIAAVGELNDAMAEAHKNSEMRVEFWPVAGPLPRTYDYRIYKLTHAAMTWFVEHDEKTGNMVGRYEPASPKPDGNVQAAGGDIGTGAIGKTRRAP
jgi:hypothetical protein